MFDDLFGFGGRRRGGKQRARRGSDLRYDLTISFEQAALAPRWKLRYPKKRIAQNVQDLALNQGILQNHVHIVGEQDRYFNAMGSSGFHLHAHNVEAWDASTDIPVKKCRGEGRIINYKKNNCKHSPWCGQWN